MVRVIPRKLQVFDQVQGCLVGQLHLHRTEACSIPRTVGACGSVPFCTARSGAGSTISTLKSNDMMYRSARSPRSTAARTASRNSCTWQCHGHQVVGMVRWLSQGPIDAATVAQMPSGLLKLPLNAEDALIDGSTYQDMQATILHSNPPDPPGRQARRLCHGVASPTCCGQHPSAPWAFPSPCTRGTGTPWPLPASRLTSSCKRTNLVK
jgi:hypothetical protein